MLNYKLGIADTYLNSYPCLPLSPNGEPSVSLMIFFIRKAFLKMLYIRLRFYVIGCKARLSPFGVGGKKGDSGLRNVDFGDFKF
jgi:hypothetical protein